MTRLDSDTKLRLLRLMLLSRLGDLREQSLIRQGKGWFHVSGMGHEALAAVGYLMEGDDYFAGYYRDRPIALGRGFSNYDLALAFFAKRTSASGGRQMPAHYSDKSRGVFSVASVVGASLLPACGIAWGLKLDGRPGAVITTVGDAGTRQGDFYEAICFAVERQLPVLFLVEDNGIGISSLTSAINPRALKVLQPEAWQEVDGCRLPEVYARVDDALKAIRAGAGPRFLWCHTERISSHSSADDQRKYRSADELASLEDKDCINRLKAELIADGVLTEKAYQELYRGVEDEVRSDYERAFQEHDPEPTDLLEHVTAAAANPPRLEMQLEERARMVDGVNRIFRAALESSRDFVFFGQDIEDPKGGVFSLTKGLSTDFPKQVFNSPLAESTILGVAVGLAAYGKRPVFEIQFTDFIWAGFNQLVTHLSTLHWRTQGEWELPAVIYAPYGAYLPGGAIWHSQANEGALAHFPGLHIAIPSTAEDAAGLFWTAMHAQSPTLMLVPKHLLWHPGKEATKVQPVPFGKARFRREGSRLTLVAWGNTVEVAEQALEDLQMEADAVDLIDLRTIAPLDYAAVHKSVRKTRRLLIVQEDARTCSVGQSLLERLASDPELFPHFAAAPRLLAKPDVHVPYNPVLEYAALPSRKSVARAIKELLATDVARSIPAPVPVAEPPPSPALEKFQESFSETTVTEQREIRVPILGEGITSARVISLLAKPGETLKQDDALCELETDKALFPVEAPFGGRLSEWLIREGDEVEVDQVIARVESAKAPTVQPATSPAGSRSPAEGGPLRLRPTEGGLSPHIVAQMKNVVPTHMTVKVGWHAIREARKQAKERLGSQAPSPTVMVAWALVKAMEKHPIFTCTTTAQDTLAPHEHFDFGVAVSLQNDALDTAVVPRANTLDWEAFLEAYQQAVERVRRGQTASKASTPLILTSMGGFSVRDALPVVVPPAIGTLFIGESHFDLQANGEVTEVVSLCLSFDHRWINGVAGSQFLSDVRYAMEHFQLPIIR